MTRPVKINSLISPVRADTSSHTNRDARSSVALAIGSGNLAERYNVTTPGKSQFRLTAQNLNVLQSNGSLHETDIFKICAKTMQPSQFAQILPPLHVKGKDKFVDQELATVEAFKIFTRVWSSYTKGLFKQVVVKNQIVICPLFGVWMQSCHLTDP